MALKSYQHISAPAPRASPERTLPPQRSARAVNALRSHCSFSLSSTPFCGVRGPDCVRAVGVTAAGLFVDTRLAWGRAAAFLNGGTSRTAIIPASAAGLTRAGVTIGA